MTDDPRLRAAARAAVLSFVVLLAACGRGKEEAAAVAPKPEQQAPVTAAPEPPPADATSGQFANAVPSGKTAATAGKTAAAVDLQYDMLAKPEPGQPFEVELAFVPRLPSDALEAEITGIPGIAVVNGGTARFENVAAGTRYTLRVLARADAPGLYYLDVVARMVTQVQTEARTFSVPVVVGTVAATQKPAPAADASGQPVEPMPATENVKKQED
jgi:hypothetical protein